MARRVLQETVRNLRIDGADLTIYLDNGAQMNIDVSPAMLELLVKGSGLQIHEINDQYMDIVRFSDETIRNVMIQRLEKLVEVPE